ncbi:hypothetical protein BB559_004591 [Furculomyces boomerangus]|uniref:Uncharacterized protein n=1 Tax=Furculomyces boomerangus TaxID=61424 RepID=A0A2T9YDS7_9FUNG|nr:hypothetical protein BB559_004591 [Furculomyces boomerangus]
MDKSLSFILKGSRALAMGKQKNAINYHKNASEIFNKDLKPSLDYNKISHPQMLNLDFYNTSKNLWILYINILTNALQSIDNNGNFLYKETVSLYQDQGLNLDDYKTSYFPKSLDLLYSSLLSDYDSKLSNLDGELVSFLGEFMLKFKQNQRAKLLAEEWLSDLSPWLILALENFTESNTSLPLDNPNSNTLENKLRSDYLNVCQFYCTQVLPALQMFDLSNEFISNNGFISETESKALLKRLTLVQDTINETKKQKLSFEKHLKDQQQQKEIKEKRRIASRKAKEIQKTNPTNLNNNIPPSNNSLDKHPNTHLNSKTSNPLPKLENSKKSTSIIISSRNTLPSTNKSKKSINRLLIEFVKRYGMLIILSTVSIEIIRRLLKKYGLKNIITLFAEKLKIAANMATKITYI